MGHVIKDRTLAEDPWRFVTDDAPLGGGDTVVSLSRWLANSATLAKRRGRVGVEFRSDDELSTLIPTLRHLQLIIIDIPAVADGRCYSLGRLLRARHSFGGEIRARGAFLLDQMQFLARCGFDAFDASGLGDPEQALQALSTFSVFYQSGADGQARISRLRDTHRARYVVDSRQLSGAPLNTPAARRPDIFAPPLPGQVRDRPARRAEPRGEERTAS